MRAHKPGPNPGEPGRRAPGAGTHLIIMTFAAAVKVLAGAAAMLAAASALLGLLRRMLDKLSLDARALVSKLLAQLVPDGLAKLKALRKRARADGRAVRAVEGGQQSVDEGGGGEIRRRPVARLAIAHLRTIPPVAWSGTFAAPPHAACCAQPPTMSRSQHRRRSCTGRCCRAAARPPACCAHGRGSVGRPANQSPAAAVSMDGVSAPLPTHRPSATASHGAERRGGGGGGSSGFGRQARRQRRRVASPTGASARRRAARAAACSSAATHCAPASQRPAAAARQSPQRRRRPPPA
eukprot:365067-Chlamydomonas_euryale.AAC.18